MNDIYKAKLRLIDMISDVYGVDYGLAETMYNILKSITPKHD